jgi:hypothetical protein
MNNCLGRSFNESKVLFAVKIKLSGSKPTQDPVGREPIVGADEFAEDRTFSEAVLRWLDIHAGYLSFQPVENL